jgi:putative transcriptional regulator
MTLERRVEPAMNAQTLDPHGMKPKSLSSLFGERMSDPAIRLLAQTTAAMRSDPDYFHREDDVAGGVFLAGEQPAGMADDSLARALARIDADAALDEQASEQVDDGDERMAELMALPSPLREAALDALQHRGWTFGGFGIRRLALMGGDGGAQAELMRVEPGFGVAEHDHAGEELTLIVTGAYGDGHARYQAGDLSVARPGFSHAPKSDVDEVCYVLAVTYGPPKFHGAFGLLQIALGFPWTPKAQ